MTAAELETLSNGYGQLLERMGKEVGEWFVDPSDFTVTNCDDPNDTSTIPAPRVWAQIYEARRPAFEAARANFENQHSQLTEELLELLKRARAKILEKIEKLEELIELCESRLENLTDKVQDLGTLLLRRAEALGAAELVIDQNAAGRAKAAALRKVVDRVVCHFKHVPTKAANRPDSILDKVEIFPASGDAPSCHLPENSPGRD